jgi:hypothetical protein
MNFRIFVILASLLLTQTALFGQGTQQSNNDLKRTFMPQFQLGYALNKTQDLSGGLITQTSIEYRDTTNLVLRINFDLFNSNMTLNYPLNDSTSFTGKTSFTDLIGGIGYRVLLKKHNITGYIQSGVRFYGYPEFNLENNQISIDLSRKNLGVMRYTLGYEYALTTKLFFSIELFSSHVFEPRDFWNNNVWSHGLTIGVTSPLF